MGKRKITVTVDAELLDQIAMMGAGSVSSVVNEALVVEVERRARMTNLHRLLDRWDQQLGPVSAAVAGEAKEAFDDLDAVADVARTTSVPTGSVAPSRPPRRGVA